MNKKILLLGDSVGTGIFLEMIICRLTYILFITLHRNEALLLSND